MWKKIIKSEIPDFNWIVLGLWDEDSENMAWQIGRKLPSEKCEFWNDNGGGPYAYDSVYPFDPNKSTHWIEIPNQPERSKREDSQRCEMRCSEHCG